MRWDPLCTFSPEHGATTVIFGNCPLSLAPVRKGAEERLGDVLREIGTGTIQAGGGQYVELKDGMIRRLAEATGRTVVYNSLSQTMRKPDEWRCIWRGSRRPRRSASAPTRCAARTGSRKT